MPVAIAAVSQHTESRELEANALEEKMAQGCGTLNAATARLVSLVGQVLTTGAFEGTGIHSPEQWVAWRCGVSGGRARRLVAMADRSLGAAAVTRPYSD